MSNTAYAKQNNLTYAKMVNHAGKVVAPTAESFLAAAASADWANAQDFRVIITDAPGDKSWPVAGSTFILMQTVPTDIASSSEALKFFDWGYKNGKQMAADLDYVPMPDRRRGVDREELERQDQRFRRQAGLLRSMRTGKGAEPGAFSFSTLRQ